MRNFAAKSTTDLDRPCENRGKSCEIRGGIKIFRGGKRKFCGGIKRFRGTSRKFRGKPVGIPPAPSPPLPAWIPFAACPMARKAFPKPGKIQAMELTRNKSNQI